MVSLIVDQLCFYILQCTDRLSSKIRNKKSLSALSSSLYRFNCLPIFGWLEWTDLLLFKVPGFLLGYLKVAGLWIPCFFLLFGLVNSCLPSWALGFCKLPFGAFYEWNASLIPKKRNKNEKQNKWGQNWVFTTTIWFLIGCCPLIPPTGVTMLTYIRLFYSLDWRGALTSCVLRKQHGGGCVY